jgi:formate hydrogenlyase subunit 3/multisubunit Na+/H+ antiporter MnhD subunit
VAIPAIAGKAPPVVAAFLWIGGQSTTLFLLQRFLVAYPWLTSVVDSARWLLWLGVFTAVLGGALAAVQDSVGRYAGYAGLYDYGILLVAMALRSTAGLPVTVWLLLTRTIALLTLATGAAIIRHHTEGDRLDEIAGAASRLPWAVAALVMGGFALAGMPLTAQFASRWALVQLVAENDTRWAFFLVLGAFGVLIGAVRVGRACFGPLQVGLDTAPGRGSSTFSLLDQRGGFGKLSGSPVEREPVGVAALAFILVAVGALLGLFPQLLTGPVAAVILPLSTLGP